jgi:hypothetical protein
MSEKSPDQRYVAHLDMLGMSELALRDPDLAWSVLCRLTQAKDERLGLSLEKVDTGELIGDRIESFTFSDTIILFSRSDEVADTYAMIILVAELFTRALYHCVPLRGGIAHGRFMFNLDHNLFAGPALVQAYHLSEDAQWLGVRVDDEIARRASEIPIRSERGKDAITKWGVPNKRGDLSDAHVLNWVETHRHTFTVAPPISVTAFYGPLTRLFGPFSELPAAVQRKYQNTVSFINSQLAD